MWNCNSSGLQLVFWFLSFIGMTGSGYSACSAHLPTRTPHLATIRVQFGSLPTSVLLRKRAQSIPSWIILFGCRTTQPTALDLQRRPDDRMVLVWSKQPRDRRVGAQETARALANEATSGFEDQVRHPKSAMGENVCIDENRMEQ